MSFATMADNNVMSKAMALQLTVLQVQQLVTLQLTTTLQLVVL
jgi:hypothetical protein